MMEKETATVNNIQDQDRSVAYESSRAVAI